MAVVTNYQCDLCKELVKQEAEVNVLSKLVASVKGKVINIDKDKHFCSPGCFLTFINELISSNGNGNK